MTCFACEPGRIAGTARRHLCQTHKASCALADGTPLLAALQRAQPVGRPLEGSLLGLVYNPIFVSDAFGMATRGLSDFTGGGMAVHETWSDTEVWFDLWVSSCDESQPILAAVLRAPVWVSSIDALSLSMEAQSWVADAKELWWRAQCVAERRRRADRWPASFAELQEILQPLAHDGMERRDEPRFVVALRQCALSARSRGAV